MQLWHEHFQQIVEEASDAILLLDTNGTIRYANPAAARLFGQAREQLEGYDFGFVVVPDEPTEIEIPHRQKGVISVDVRTVPMQMGADRVSAVYLRDVTDRKRAEQAAREKDAIFENLLQKVPDIAIQGYCMDGSVFYWNKASETIYGYTAREALQSNLLDLIIPDTMKAQARKALRVVKAGGPAPGSGPLTLKRKDGTPVQVYSVHTTLESGTDDLRLFCMDVDLTEKNRDQLRLQEAIQAGNIGLFDWDLHTQKVFYSREWKQQLGHEDREIGNSYEEWSSRLHPEDRQASEQRVREFLANPRGRLVYETRMRHKDGSYRWILAQASLIRGADGLPARMVGSHLDITERHATEESLQRLAFAVDQSPSIVVITDTQGHIQYVNHQFCNVTGFSLEDVSGLSAQDLGSTHPPGIEDSRVFSILSEAGLWEGQFRNVKKNGEVYWEQACIYPIRNTQGEITHYIKLAEDITDKKQLSERLDFLAFHDPLTGLPNRELLIDRLTQAMAMARRDRHVLAVAFLDLDDFKVINDSLGHEQGDALLVQVSQRLREHLREGDTVARFGGDEFLLLLSNLHKAQDLIPVVEHLQEAFSQPFTLGDTPVVISFSIGMAVFPHDSERPEELIRHADAAMHRAKTQGRRSYNFYTRELDEQLQDRMQLEQAMRQGLENQEFFLCYQPRVELSTGRIISLEALVRWNHPQWGLVSPGRFIPLAEETGFILALGPEVLRLACLQIRQWDEQGMPAVPVAINLSAREFHQPDILERTLTILEKTGVEPARIEFEITESAAMSSVERTIETLALMNARGFHFSIDDFGTAYSSLNYLKRLPVQAVKIDQSFVLDLEDNPELHPEDSAIIRAIIGLGHTLGLEVIAEGVETPAQRDFLIRHDCQVGQGFLFSPAVPGEQIRSMMLKQVAQRPK
ncbi:EAL domain-containing protein [Ectothiorhodospira haloalkaliphila]|uniref:sensor domain-containing protein n=1 Tax=Ectothiorhodospira haloalkaliphila TaxID=421628 RepID=UPI001EE87475|nr:EAL domain-containing protein [Ectothiorhodospira haloalkaliphila]MCG5525089.1 EAL domain-containing protein [Ectothiorhodospira haloalkaliphila]